jgi:hypothetical protein
MKKSDIIEMPAFLIFWSLILWQLYYTGHVLM